MITEKLSTNGTILDVKSKANISFIDMLNGIEYLNNDKLSRELRIIESATDSLVSFTIDDIDILINEMYNIAKKYTFIRHAVIHNSPKNTAFAMLMKNNTMNSNYVLEVFSTRKSALKWLNVK